MEFKFPVNDIFKQNCIEIGPNLIPPGFSGDRRTYWDTVGKVSEIINAMGEASAAAQGLTKPITTAERLRNSEHTVYLLIDQNAGNGRGAVTGLLKTGKKGLYVFDRNGQHFQVSPPCVLDFYVHESRQRTGLGKRLFEHMLQKEQVEPVKMAIDRPSDKFLGFLNKHYNLNNPVKQMNNYVVFDGFFPGTPEKNAAAVEVNSSTTSTPGKKLSANGLQAANYVSPMGRYGAPRPPCSMGQIIHNQSSTIATSAEPTGVRSAPETNFQSVATNNSPPLNQMGYSQSTPNMYSQQINPQIAQQNVHPNIQPHNKRLNLQQNSENMWQSLHGDPQLYQNYFNNANNRQNISGESQPHIDTQYKQSTENVGGDALQYYQLNQQQILVPSQTEHQIHRQIEQPNHMQSQIRQNEIHRQIDQQHSNQMHHQFEQQNLIKGQMKQQSHIQQQIDQQNLMYQQQQIEQQKQIQMQQQIGQQQIEQQQEKQMEDQRNETIGNVHEITTHSNVLSPQSFTPTTYQKEYLNGSPEFSRKENIVHPQIPNVQSVQNNFNYQQNHQPTTLDQNQPQNQQCDNTMRNTQTVMNTLQQIPVSTQPLPQYMLNSSAGDSNIMQNYHQSINTYNIPQEQGIPSAQSQEIIVPQQPNLRATIVPQEQYAQQIPSQQNVHSQYQVPPQNMSSMPLNLVQSGPQISRAQSANSLTLQNTLRSQMTNNTHLMPQQMHSAREIAVPLAPNYRLNQEVSPQINQMQMSMGNLGQTITQLNQEQPPIASVPQFYEPTANSQQNLTHLKNISNISPNVTSSVNYLNKKNSRNEHFEGQYKKNQELVSQMQNSRGDMGANPAVNLDDVLAYGYPPQTSGVDTQVMDEAITSSPKLERPRSLSIQLDEEQNEETKLSNADDLESKVQNAVPLKTISSTPPENKIINEDAVDKLTISQQESDKSPGKRTPSHLTEQGFFDLKFYHNKLW